ncbi:MAG: NnrS family protein, partial [Thiohalomonadales bacterium]
MSLIEEPPGSSETNSKYAFLHLAFRPFFLGTTSFAVVAMALWMWVYSFGGLLPVTAISPFVWHAHEMIFGYTVGVISGFLLTAIQNWTGVPTIKGKSLLILFLLWVGARILFFIPVSTFEVTAIIDLLFFVLLIVAASKPVFQVKQYKQFGIILVLLLLLVSNSIFYLGVFQIIENGIHIGLYSGLYLILLLIFIMARRVIPFFIEKGVDRPVQIKNFKWIDISVLIIFILYALFDIFSLHQSSLMLFSGLLLILHSIRMIGWYSNGLWSKPLLWSLYVAYGFIVLGFALKLLIHYYGFLPFLEIHSFAVGGIGLMTLAMMSRVALGHTGRNVFEPPKLIFWIVLVFTIA